MLRIVLGAFVAIIFMLFAAPSVLAKDASVYAQKKKKAAKKNTSAKRQLVSKTRSQKRSLTAKQGKRLATRSAKHVGKKTVSARSARKTYVAGARTKRLHTASNALSRAALNLGAHPLVLRSNAALVFDQDSAEVLYAKNANTVLPIASITKLMTALIVVESHQDMNEVLEVTREDIDTIKHTGSRLPIGSTLTRANMLHIALMSSENRAASALGRHYPGGMAAFVKAMNEKAQSLGMNDTHYVEPTGLSSHNVSSARDLVKLVTAAHQHAIIREYSTNRSYEVELGGPVLQYRNSNHLISNPDWEIELQKTGYIAEAGRCLVMHALIEGRPIVMVFLDAKGRYSRSADAGNIRKWLEEVKMPTILRASSEGAR
jgi:D-alanyl-D-alanine endopeptidase (penicillin-binding protein 7)